MAKITNEMLLQILQAIGGANNVKQCGNCMTRLRLTLQNEQYVDKAAIKQIDGVLGVIESDQQLQIVLGPGKAQTAAEMMNQLLETASQDDAPITEQNQDLNSLASTNKQQLKQKQTTAVHRFLSKFATIFTPLIPGFIAAGLLLGIATLIKQSVYPQGLPDDPAAHGHLVHLILYMSIFAKGLFSFLGILIGYNAQKAFGGSGVNGAIIASIFMLGYNPEISSGVFSGMSTFFGLEIDPRGNIIGILIACIFGAWVEKQVRKIIPGNLDMILTSTLTLLIVGAVTYVAIMPIGSWLFSGMSWLFMHLNSNPFGTAILAGLFLIAVMFGVHQGFIPVYLALVDAQGFNSLFPILAMAGGGQVGAAIALYVKAKKNSLLRNQIRGAIIPGFLGIAEPLIYGVTLPRVKPFITACLGGAAGGFFIGLVAWMGLPMGLNTVFGPSGLVAIPLMTSASGVFAAMSVYVIGLLIAYLCGFIFTYFFGSKNTDLT
ncbi:PTS N-acetylmuramic acid transporter subunit IIBC [Moellerella wisconsensis]|uniref:PTS N-acetylmuramic acid transporter subunit IIBC n=1 Tax=Moellerella wisconsensis TaxID=158849 RepID=UPI0006413C3C|nr:PTS N-acetylmuramic acid transporter subunit IIBC [Moellerella wisconsensis]KLN97547.1 PTS system N-acetylmuramic acid transporter subunits IIBC [Moellerella wisconsensis]